MTTNTVNWLDTSKQTLANMKSLGEINYTLMNRLAQQQMEVFSICLESGVKQMQAMSEAKDINAFMNSEAELADEAGKKILSNVQGTLEVLDGTKAQWVDWAETSMKDFPKAAA